MPVGAPTGHNRRVATADTLIRVSDAVVRAFQTEDEQAYRSAMDDAVDAHVVDQLIAQWATVVAFAYDGAQVIEPFTDSRLAEAAGPSALHRIVDAGRAGPDAVLPLARSAIAELDLADLWKVTFVLAQTYSTVVAATGGRELLASLMQIHRQYAETPEEIAVADRAAAVIGAWASRHVEDARDLLEKTRAELDVDLLVVPRLWLNIYLRWPANPSMLIDAKGTPQKMLRPGRARRGTPAERAVWLINQILTADTATDPLARQRLLLRYMALDSSERWAFTDQLAANLGWRTAQLVDQDG